ncbi:MAG: glycoside hydrolase family 16 protein [Prevotellaceae bacterium]|nr:glycoside hydrolase family 16 protein [Prevotellaceae bacterium]
MSTLIRLTLLSVLLATAIGAQAKDNARKPRKTVDQYEGYRLVWHDEFDKKGTPSSCWDYEQGFVRNKEAQWYQPDNARVKGGALVIEGRRETVPNSRYDSLSNDWRRNRPEARYTSSCLTTRKSFTFRYGRVEVRAKIPAVQGAWPAIWLLGNMYPWPENGEIDIMEYYIRDGEPSILANACWAAEKPTEAAWQTGRTPYTHFTDLDPEWAEKYHLWRMDWDESFIRIYLDGELLNEIDLSLTRNKGGRHTGFNPFSNQLEGFGCYLLLNLAMGSSGGDVDDSLLPLSYCVDYVRVYQKD